MNRPQFRKGDVIVHTNTGVVCEVRAAKKDPNELYNILITRSQRGHSEWMNSEYYTLKTVYDSPLFKALK